jgi:DNA repair exonuclease SbcCD nuclease subunit
MKVKFAHISDVHLGAWRNERLNELGYKAFEETVNIIIKEEVDFVVISGDLYDISNPKVEVIDVATRELKKLKDHEIQVYGICGSHDFSPSNKSMIRPLISAGLFINVSEGNMMENGKLKLDFFQDQKTQIKLTGLRARKRSLEIEDYNVLDIDSLQSEKGPKIFILHTMLSELKPKEYKDMESAPKSLLPQDFDYYAGGHLHKTLPEKLRTKEFYYDLNRKNNIVYSGCIFPTNFREFETIKFGGFCIISGESKDNKLDLKVKYIPVKVKDVESISLNCANKSASMVQNLLKQELLSKDFRNKIVTVRIYGSLSSGQTYEIKSNEIIQKIKDMGAFEVLVNKNSLTTAEYKSISVSAGKSKEEIEATLIKEHSNNIRISNIPPAKMENIIYQLFSTLGAERQIGTKVMNYNESLKQTFLEIFEIKKSKELKQ